MKKTIKSLAETVTLENQVGIVTGGSSGIGAATVECAVLAGAKEVIIADVNEKAGRQLSEDLDGKASFFKLDITDRPGCDSLRDHMKERFGRCDFLVNNAGVGAVHTILDAEDTDFDRVLKTNVTGTYNLSRRISPIMAKEKSGVIINTASVGGLRGLADRTAYIASKFAIVGLTYSMALDLGQYGIRVGCVCPCRVESPFVTQRLNEYPDPEKARREMSSTQIFGRMAEPEEVARAIVFHLTGAVEISTGFADAIDSGWSAGFMPGEAKSQES